MEGKFLMVSTNVCFGFDLAILLAHTLVLSFGVGLYVLNDRTKGTGDELDGNEMEWY